MKLPKSVHFAITALDAAALETICRARGLTDPPPEGAIVGLLRGALQREADAYLLAQARGDGSSSYGTATTDADPLVK